MNALLHIRLPKGGNIVIPAPVLPTDAADSQEISSGKADPDFYETP